MILITSKHNKPDSSWLSFNENNFADDNLDGVVEVVDVFDGEVELVLNNAFDDDSVGAVEVVDVVEKKIEFEVMLRFFVLGVIVAAIEEDNVADKNVELLLFSATTLQPDRKINTAPSSATIFVTFIVKLWI